MGTFTLTASYTSDSPLPEGFDRHVATWTIGPVPARKDGKPPKVKVQVSLNLHGLVVLQSAVVVEEEDYEEVVRKPLAKVRLSHRSSAILTSMALRPLGFIFINAQSICNSSR